MFSRVADLPVKSAINAVLPQLLNLDERIKWRAVALGGFLIASLAAKDMEAGRIYIRRLMWNLTEESGGCPLGSPELIGEALANHRGLAEEFANISISYLDPDGNYLDHEPLLRGATWGVGRLAESFPELTTESVPYLCKLTRHDDYVVKGIACWALGNLNRQNTPDSCDIENLLNDQTVITIFIDFTPTEVTIADLARRIIG